MPAIAPEPSLLEEMEEVEGVEGVEGVEKVEKVGLGPFGDVVAAIPSVLSVGCAVDVVIRMVFTVPGVASRPSLVVIVTELVTLVDEAVLGSIPS